MDRAALSIVSKLGQLAVDELKEICGVGDKVVHLMDELSTMNAFLRMISEADQSTIDHLMREWEKQVRELAYDAEDCADTYWLRVNVNRADAPLLRYMVKWPKYQLKKLLLRRALAADVKALLARAAAVSERRVRYGIDRAALPRSPWFAPVSTVSASANALRLADDPDGKFVGIKKQVTALANKIKAEDSDKRLKVFSVVGFGGLGKTTLAVELCRHLDADFQRQALVSVSQEFDGGRDMKGLLARVLKQIVKVKKDDNNQTSKASCTLRGEEVVVAPSTTQGKELEIDQIHQMDVDQLSSNLEEQLMGKRYLIVIDDVWSVPAWEAIHNKLPKNNCGSRIIVTTRIETVASASSVSEDLIHHMEALDAEDSKKLFVKRAFGSVGGTCPDELKGTMDKILKKCGGLPLAIVSISSLLASYNSVESVDMWIKVSDSIGSHMESHPSLEGMRQVITLSYDYLPHHLKACMKYLSIFPEDYVIAKDRLLYRWIAEGLVAEKQGLTLFDVAEEYFNELISRNMIQPSKLVETSFFFPPEIVESCQVHDMMLEVMVSKSRDANFVSMVGKQYRGGFPGGKVRRLSIHGHDDGHSSAKKKKGIETMNLQHVRSLTTFQLKGLDKLLDKLGEFKLLRVLDLEDCMALKNKHMKNVCKLYLLRFLSLRGTGISLMPSKIGELEYLETINVEGTRIQSIPRTMTKLSKLESFRVLRWEVPRGVGNMKALHELDCACLEGDIEVVREICELQQLQVLSVIVLNNAKEFLHALGSSLSKTCALRSLHLISDTLDFLLDISSPPTLLRRLILQGRISRFPDWISSLKHLTEFSMRSSRLAGDQVFGSLCNLPNLQIIQLSVGPSRGSELVARTIHKFPALRILNLYLGSAVTKLKFEKGSMTKLETLLLKFSGEQRIVGTDNLKNLKEVKLGAEKNNPSLEPALQQLKEQNKNRPESNQIKVAVDYSYGHLFAPSY